MIVNTFQLGVTFSNQPSFVMLNTPIKFSFDFINPPTTNGYLPERERRKCPSVIGLKSLEFLVHGLAPMGMFGSFCITVRLQNSRQLCNEGLILRREPLIGQIIRKRIPCTRTRMRGVGEGQRNSRTNIIMELSRRNSDATGMAQRSRGCSGRLGRWWTRVQRESRPTRKNRDLVKPVSSRGG
ncbi:hypothetical protein PS2_021223 [Malus domestica]